MVQSVGTVFFKCRICLYVPISPKYDQQALLQRREAVELDGGEMISSLLWWISPPSNLHHSFR